MKQLNLQFSVVTYGGYCRLCDCFVRQELIAQMQNGLMIICPDCLKQIAQFCKDNEVKILSL